METETFENFARFWDKANDAQNIHNGVAALFLIPMSNKILGWTPLYNYAK